MKLMHLSDLHLGKRLNELSMLDEQEYILAQILGIAVQEKVDAVMIAGDVYDKSIPPAEAVSLFDSFLYELSKNKISAFVISGNHDSAERIAFGGRLMSTSGVYMSPIYDGTVTPVTLGDDHGAVHVYMLPFIKPAHVRACYGGETTSYNEAMRTVLEHIALDEKDRNILMTHQFVTGATRSDSEEISVGGTDNVDAELFAKFDYVALGHLHTPQNCGAPHIRYCGTPLKYSFSEANDKKSVTVVELGKKGDLAVRTVALKPLHDLVEIRGRYEDITLKSFYENTTWREDYTHITLTDEDDVPDAIGKLRAVYHGLMKLDYDNRRTRQNNAVETAGDVETKTPFELFAEFYALQNNQELSGEQATLVQELIEKIWEEEA